MQKVLQGRCLCGGVSFLARPARLRAGVCHCKMCRRWGGGLPFVVVNAAVELQSGDSLRWHKSSPWGERGFCATCGSSLFFRGGGAAEWAVSAGALDDDGAISALREHIFIDDKPAFYDLADSAPRLRGAEFTARVLADLQAQHGGEFLQEALAMCRQHNGDAFADEVAQNLQTREGR